ncbi:MAG: hypothetical protein H6995_15900 [Pseudomonadales bacterium]|nr:hypothetical protein [Pseudomonadales bacterium]
MDDVGLGSCLFGGDKNDENGVTLYLRLSDQRQQKGKTAKGLLSINVSRQAIFWIKRGEA